MESSQTKMALPKPLYSQVRDMLARRITSGEWRQGGTLPNENALASEFGVSIGTVRRAVEGLEDFGLVVRKQGRGTYVTAPGSSGTRQRFGRLKGADGQLLELEYESKGAQVRTSTRAEARRLGLAEGSKVLEVRHHVSVGGRLYGYEDSVVAAEPRTAEVLQAPHAKDLISMLAECGSVVTRIEESVHASTATEDEQRLMSLAPATPLLVLDRSSYLSDQRLAAITRARYIANEVKYWSARG